MDIQDEENFESDSEILSAKEEAASIRFTLCFEETGLNETAHCSFVDNLLTMAKLRSRNMCVYVIN